MLYGKCKQNLSGKGKFKVLKNSSSQDKEIKEKNDIIFEKVWYFTFT